MDNVSIRLYLIDILNHDKVIATFKQTSFQISYFYITAQITVNKLIVSLIAFTLLFACNKSSTPKPDPTPTPVTPVPVIPIVPASLVTSYSMLIGVSNSMTSDTIRYDEKNNIQSITHKYVNNLGPDQTLDSGTYYFTINSTGTRPSGYRVVYKKYYYTRRKRKSCFNI